MTGVLGIGASPVVPRRDVVAAATGLSALTLFGAGPASARPAAAGPTVRPPENAPVPSPVPIRDQYPNPVTRAQLADRIEDYLEDRTGTVGVAVYDRRTRVMMTHGVFRNETLSTVKVVVLVALLRRAQAQGRGLTSTERSDAVRMIQYSDNAATDRLLASLGVPAVQRAADLMGMRYTHIKGLSSGWWGSSTTWPGDLVRMMNSIVWGSVLTSGRRSYARDLMAGITSSQRWGVCDPPLPTSVRSETKNGWGSMTSGYRLNSVGHITGNGRDYTMAILSRSPLGYTYGKATVNGVATVVYRALWRQLR